MNQIDALLAKNRAIVESWGLGEVAVVQTKEERDAEFKQLRQNEPPNLGLGCPVPQEWLDEDGEKRTGSKWQATTLRRNMGLQASKPRNAAGRPAAASGEAGGDSSEEEDVGRSGLGKVKNAKRGNGGRKPENRGEPSPKVPQDIRESIEKDAPSTSFATNFKGYGVEEQPGLLDKMEGIESWKQETAQASPASEPESVTQKLAPETAGSQTSNSKSGDDHQQMQVDLIKRVKTKQSNSKKHKLVPYSDSEEESEEKSAKQAKANPLLPVQVQEKAGINQSIFFKLKEELNSASQSSTPNEFASEISSDAKAFNDLPTGGLTRAGRRKLSKRKKMEEERRQVKSRDSQNDGNDDESAKMAGTDETTETGVEKPEKQAQTDAEAKAAARRARELARERMGSGSSFKKKRGSSNIDRPDSTVKKNKKLKIKDRLMAANCR